MNVPALLSSPVPIVFTVANGIQQVDGGALNILSIYDRVNIEPGPQGQMPDTVTIQVFTLWTGGQGDFEQVIEILDEDGHTVVTHPAPFSLRGTSHRHGIAARITIPARAGVYSIVVGRADMPELLRQDFTIAVA